MKNALKTAVLLAGLGALFMLIGGAIGGGTGLLIGLVLALVMVGGSYRSSDRLASRRRARKAGHPGAVAERVRDGRGPRERAGMPMPKLYVSPEMQPNAFATGRSPDHAAVCVTQGILQVLDDDELRGVLAHELSHVKNRDILISSVAAAIALGITFVANMAMWGAMFGGGDDDDRGDAFGAIAMMILAPIAAGCSRRRSAQPRFQADDSGAHLLHDGESLARALE